MDRPLIRLDVDLGSDFVLRDGPTGGPGSGLILSPDGSRLLYFASVGGKPVKLYMRRLDQPASIELPGTDQAAQPFFSPDAQWIGFWSRDKVYKMSVEGGAAVPVGDSAITFGAAWGEDGNIILGNRDKGLLQIPSAGGALATITELTGKERMHTFPEVLPDGKAILFLTVELPEARRQLIETIEALSLADRRRKTIFSGVFGGTPRYFAATGGSGYVLYLASGSLFALPFDPKLLEPLGTPVPVVDQVAAPANLGNFGQYDVSRNGTLVYHKGGTSGTMKVEWLDASGTRQPLLAQPGAYTWVRLSPDGRRLAVAIYDTNGRPSIWIYDQQRDTLTQLTHDDGTYPLWSPDGRYIVFSSAGGISWIRSDAASPPQPLIESKAGQYPTSFTSDGKRLAYFESSQVSSTSIWTVPLVDNGSQLKAGTPEQFLNTQFQDRGAAFSPDNRWLAYASHETGKSEVYVRPFRELASGRTRKWPISNGGGDVPVWSRNGRELFYLVNDRIMAVTYSVQDEAFIADKPRVWAGNLGAARPGATSYDFAPDGKRLALITSASPDVSAHDVTFLFNFADELRRRVPLSK